MILLSVAGPAHCRSRLVVIKKAVSAAAFLFVKRYDVVALPGQMTLRQLLATWTAHDLSHIVQVSRVMAKRYRHEVGPWAEYLPVMK